MGEARLWYVRLGAAQLYWQTLQDSFHQQYSKFGSTKEQYFHAWRSFQFDENADMNSFIYSQGHASYCSVRLWRTTDLRTFQKYPAQQTILHGL